MKGFKIISVESNYYAHRLDSQFEIWKSNNGLYSVFRAKPDSKRFYGTNHKLLLSNKSKGVCQKFIDKKICALVNGVNLAEVSRH